MLVLYVLGGIGLVLLLGGLVLGDVLDGVFDALDTGTGVTAAVGAALTALGFGGALLANPLGLLVGTLTGAALGVVVGIATFLLVRLALGQEPTPAPASSDLFGAFGTVISPVPAGGFGQVALTVRGSRVQVSARSEEPLDAGRSVYVTEVLSATAVVVSGAGLLPSS